MSDETPEFDPVALRVTGNRYTDQFVAAAGDLGLAVELVDKSRGLVRIFGNGRNMAVRAAIVGCNSLVAAKMASNKVITNTRLHRAGFRVPPFDSVVLAGRTSFDDVVDRLRSFARARYPVVLKAEKGHGGVNVFAGLADEGDLLWALKQLLQAGETSILIEQHIFGRDYRIKMFDGVVIDLIVRMPGVIEGDGKATIAELIDQLRVHREREHISPVVITPKLLRLLERSGKSLDDVLAAGVVQPISVECNEGSGGYSRKLPIDCLPSAVAEWFGRVAIASGLRYLAVDFICDDIESDDSHLTGYINEINSAPVINEYITGKTRRWYLSHARYLLERYFDLQNQPQLG